MDELKMPFVAPNVERKTFSILQVLANTPKPLGSIVIARELKDLGVDLGERAVRYHLKLTDEHGLTRLAGRRDGRQITDLGLKELKQGMVKEKVGFPFPGLNCWRSSQPLMSINAKGWSR
jgi:HTH-type transcriptional regulator, global nitrogen regulator NrpRI